MTSADSPVASRRLWFRNRRSRAKGRDRDLGRREAVCFQGRSAITSYGDNCLPLPVRTRHGVEDAASEVACKPCEDTGRDDI